MSLSAGLGKTSVLIGRSRGFLRNGPKWMVGPLFYSVIVM